MTMATEFSTPGSHSVPSWRQKDSFTGRIISNEEGSKVDEVKEKRKRISYEKEYFMKMLKNIENQSPIIMKQRYETDKAGNDDCNDSNQKEKQKERKHFLRKGLTLQTSDSLVNAVDKIIERSKDGKNSSPLPIGNSTKDAGEMINYLLNKTYPNSFKGNMKPNPVNSTTREAPLNRQKQRGILGHCHSWRTLKNDNENLYRYNMI